MTVNFVIDLADPELYANAFPHDVFRELRMHDPVSWRPQDNGRGYWAVTRYDDVVAVLKTPTVYSAWKGGVLLDDPPPEFLAKLRESMMNRDPPDHTRLRKLVNHVFSPKRITLLEAAIARHASALVDGVRERGECDFAADIAGAMPLFVICEILGVPLEDRQMLYGFTNRMFNSELQDRTAALQDGMDAANSMRGYGAELGRIKSVTPTDDLTSDLLAAEIDGRRLTEGEFQAFFMLLFNAGADTTRAMLCHGLDLLLAHPESLSRVRADLGLLPGAIEEICRYESPVIHFRRTATADTELAGKRITEGDKVVVFFPSANHDETAFTDPSKFDIARTPNHHLSFGHGTHFCLGAPLARLESKHVLREFLALPELEAIGPMVRARSNFLRSVRSQPVRFRAHSPTP